MISITDFQSGGSKVEVNKWVYFWYILFLFL